MPLSEFVKSRLNVSALPQKANRYCAFNGCKNTSRCKDIHLYRFPKEEKRCEAWVEASQNKKLVGLSPSVLYSKTYLCSDHFQEWCFLNTTTKHRLVHNAIPNSEKPKVNDEISNLEQAASLVSSGEDNHSSLLRQLLLSSSGHDEVQNTVPKAVSSSSEGNGTNSSLEPVTGTSQRDIHSFIPHPGQLAAGQYEDPGDIEISEENRRAVTKKSSAIDKLRELDFIENCLLKGQRTELSGKSVSVGKELSPLKQGSVPSKVPHLSIYLSSGSPKRKVITTQTPLTRKKRKVCSIGKSDKTKIQGCKLAYERLLEELEYIEKPEPSWTISHTLDFVICARWDIEGSCECRVLVYKDLSTKIFIRNVEISFPDTSVQSLESLSQLLHKVNGLTVCQGFESRFI